MSGCMDKLEDDTTELLVAESESRMKVDLQYEVRDTKGIIKSQDKQARPLPDMPHLLS